jgi:cold shock CspA family protein/ribosome-associated translation inhibitor RaiA
MEVPLQISFQGFDSSPAVEARIREKVSGLEKLFDRIVACRVVIEKATARHHKGDLFSVRIDLSVPGREIVVDHDPGRSQTHQDVYVAIRDSFNAAKRQLQDYAREHRVQDVKAHPVPHHGTVVRLFPDEAYGFIEMGDGREIYFHRNSVAEGGWDRVDVGIEVRFTEAEGEKGPHAINVSPVDA